MDDCAIDRKFVPDAAQKSEQHYHVGHQKPAIAGGKRLPGQREYCYIWTPRRSGELHLGRITPEKNPASSCGWARRGLRKGCRTCGLTCPPFAWRALESCLQMLNGGPVYCCCELKCLRGKTRVLRQKKEHFGTPKQNGIFGTANMRSLLHQIQQAK